VNYYLVGLELACTVGLENNFDETIRMTLQKYQLLLFLFFSFFFFLYSTSRGYLAKYCKKT